MSDWQEIREMAAEIETYAELMEDEYGEALLLLCQLNHRSEYLGDDFGDILGSKIRSQLEYLKENCKIVKTEQETKETRTYVDIEWINE